MNVFLVALKYHETFVTLMQTFSTHRIKHARIIKQGLGLSSVLHVFILMVSALDKAKRALVSLLKKLAAKYGCAVEVDRDLRMKRPALGKTAFKVRVRAVLRTKKTQLKAAQFARNMLKVCKEVKAKKGAASGC